VGILLKIDRKKLDLAMAKKCYNITDLVKKSSVCYSSIVKISNGNMSLTTRTLGKIAKALDVEPKDLIQE
jgi:DNA-binding Xre family transcriptional regulator